MLVQNKPQMDNESSINKIFANYPQQPMSFPIYPALVATARIAFGIAWAVGAWLKWQPAFISHFADQISSAIDGQPAIIQAWLSFWLHIVNLNPSLFGYLAALTETALAICFVCGVFSNTAAVVSILWSLSIWTIPEAFGGPFVAGTSTDIGTGFPYIIISLLLLVVASGHYYGLDSLITKKLGRFGFLAASSKLRQ